MNSKYLSLKFAFVAVLIGVCLLAYRTNGLKEGIDLRGGHSLIFEIRTPEVEIASLNTELRQRQVEYEGAGGARKTQLKQEIDSLGRKIDDLKGQVVSTQNLPEKMIGILKKRIDPTGLNSLEWRPIGKNRIEIRMPAGSDQSIQAKQVFLSTLAQIENSNLTRSKIREVQQASGKQRSDLIAKYAGKGKQAKELVNLAAINDRLVALENEIPQLKDKVRQAVDAEGTVGAAPATTPGATTKATAPKTPVELAREALNKAVAEQVNKGQEYRELYEQIEQGNISASDLTTALRSYLPPQEAKTLQKENPKEFQRRQQTYDRAIASLAKKYPDRKGELDKAVVAYKEWSAARRSLDDPSDLERLIRKSGVLEFRIGPTMGGTNDSISQVDAIKYIQELQKDGPDAGRKRNDRLQWFPVRQGQGADLQRVGLVVEEWTDGRDYILLHNDPGHALLNPPGRTQWSLAAAWEGQDERGRPAVHFSFDPRGASLFSRLTGNNIQNQMAILLDDEVYSSAVIQAQISESGIITGDFSRQDVQQMVNTFEAGSLPAKLNPDPVAVSSFGSALGEINKKASIQAAYYSLIAVGLFMLVYYMLSGAIADFAMVLNILLVLGAMSLMQATFTMPGIAGVILAIGMSVDANVLINERLREEQQRGLPIRQALKVAYEKAFSAIMDSNATTLITALILAYVGTEEIRGFAITLALGIIFNMFTAVLVTRWIFELMLKIKMIRNHQYMLHILRSVPKINWIGLRYYFWGFSIIIAILGIAALISQGRNILGIEFSAGTKATLVFKGDALIESKGAAHLPNDRVVEEAFKDAAKSLIAQSKGPNAVRDRANNVIDFTNLFENSKVETVLDPDAIGKFMAKYGKSYDPASSENKIALADWKGDKRAFEALDSNHDKVVTQGEAKSGLRSSAYTINTTETRLEAIRAVATKAFQNEMVNRPRLQFTLVKGGQDPRKLAAQLGVPLEANGLTPIAPNFRDQAKAEFRNDLEDFEGGLLLVVDNVSPAASREDIEQRFADMKLQPDEELASLASNPIKVVGLTHEGDNYTSFAILSRPTEGNLSGDDQGFAKFSSDMSGLVTSVLEREEAITASNFDPQFAGDASTRAILALIFSWIGIILYLWLRFGKAAWGFAAVICLVHDVIIVLGMVAVSAWLSKTAIGEALLISSFKVDPAMIAAILTVIGYSVNDTIVVFDRIRENRGKLSAVTPQIINRSINQTLSRTLLTGLAVFMVVIIMYIWAGESIRGFNYALLIGMSLGVFSSIAVASPILLGFKRMVTVKAAQAQEEAEPKPAVVTVPESGK